MIHKLTERWIIFKQYVGTHSYKTYQGAMLVPSWSGYSEHHCTGRVMVDPLAAYKFGDLRPDLDNANLVKNEVDWCL